MMSLISNLSYYCLMLLGLLFLFRKGSDFLSEITFVPVFFLVLISICALTLMILKPVLFVPLQFLPSIIISRVIDRNALRQSYLQGKTNFSRVQFSSVDRTATLDGVVYLHSPSQTSKWIVFANANGVPYEQNLQFLEAYGQAMKCNVMSFNYRGVGDSQGWPIFSSDLGLDTTSAVKYLMETYSLSEKQIVVHGHSIGGGTLVHVRKQFPNIRLVNDRSYSSLSLVVRRMMDLTPLGSVMGYLLSLIFFFLLRSLMAFSQSRLETLYQGLKPLSIMHTLFLAMFVGYLLSSTRAMGPISLQMLKFWGWEVDVASHWTSPDKDLILFHPQDGMISYPTSLHSALSLQQPSASSSSSPTNINALQLSARGDPGFSHMYPLDYDPAEWEKIIKRVQHLFDQKKTD